VSFYIYLHSKPDGTPFYVGKGSGTRSSNFKCNRNRHHRNVVAKYGRENIKISVIPCASEEEAFSEEIALIAALRGLGYALTNMTSGGEGCSANEETRLRMSEIQRGRPKSAETRAKLSAANKGKVMPIAERLRRSLTMKAKGITPPSNAGKRLGPQTTQHKENIWIARTIGFALREAERLSA